MQTNPALAERKQRIDSNMSKIKHKIVVMSGKGGVGKTTTSVNLAYGLSLRGYKVGILDADLHGPNIPIMFGKEGVKLSKISEPLEITENLHISSLSFFVPDNSPVVWKGPQKITAIMEMLEGIKWGEIDYLIVDLPPGTGDETLGIAQNIGTDSKAIIVTTPQKVSLLDSTRSINFAKLINLNVLGVIENMSGFICPDCQKEVNIFKKGGAEKMAQEKKTDFLGSIPLDGNIVESSDNGLPFISNDSLASRRMNDIIAKVIEKTENENTKSTLLPKENLLSIFENLIHKKADSNNTDLEKYVESYQFLKEKNIASLSELKESITDLRDKNYKTTRAIKDNEKKIDVKVQLIDQAEKYLKHKDTYKVYTKLKKNKQDTFYNEHTAEIILFESAKKYLKE